MASPSRVVSSWITTASAPGGTTPPVKILHRLAGADRAAKRPSGRDFADHLELRAEHSVSRTHGVTVHRRHRVRRLRQPRCDVARQHASAGLIQRHLFFGQSCGAVEHGAPGIAHRHQRSHLKDPSG